MISKFLSCLPKEILNIVVIEMANRNNVTKKELVCLVNSICLAESLEFTKNDQDKVKHKRLLKML